MARESLLIFFNLLDTFYILYSILFSPTKSESICQDLKFGNMCRKESLDKLETPSAEQLIQPDGSLKLEAASQWVDAGAKMNLLISAQSRHGQSEELTHAVQTMKERQVQLALSCKQALVRSLMVRAPKAVTALAVVLCPDDSSKLPSADFTSAIDILQKVSDMNLKLLFTFDFNLLGSHNGKKLSEFMESSSKVFSTGTAVADWMKMLGLFLTVFDIAVSISIISIM